MTLDQYLSFTATSRRVFAERIGVSQVSITRYLAGSRLPRPDEMRRIYDATGGMVSADDFYGFRISRTPRQTRSRKVAS